MRALADAERIRRFMRALGAGAPAETRVYFNGGATAVLEGWRESTIDVDVRIEPDRDALFRAIARLKDDLHINVELASPDHFIPVRPGWQDRSPSSRGRDCSRSTISNWTPRRSQRSSAVTRTAIDLDAFRQAVLDVVHP